MSGGRPSKYDPSYCEAIVAHMADGASMTSFAAEIDVCRATLNVWTAEYPEFLDAVSRAKAKCAAWWEKTNRILASTGTGNATACVFGLKNMSADDWRDKQEYEHSGKDGAPLPSIEIRLVPSETAGAVQGEAK